MHMHVMFRLVGGDASPPSPPLNPPLVKALFLKEFLVTCQHQATASDLPFYDIFARSKSSSFKVFDDVIAYDLWFGPLQSKILATPMRGMSYIGENCERK